MKSFLRTLPFIFVFILIFGLQAKWATDNQVKPYLEPFGRESQAGHTSVNRSAQLLGQNRYVWLGDNNLMIATIDPATQGIHTEQRPAPANDLFSHTLYSLVGDDIFWVGNKEVLKHSTWQEGKWSTPTEIAQHANSVYAVQAGNRKLLVAGLDGAMKIWTVSGDQLIQVRSYPAKKITHINGTLDAKGKLNIGAIDELASSLANMLYVTVDPVHLQASDLTIMKNVSLPSSLSVQDSSFGIDKTHGYFLVTYMNTRSMTASLKVYSFSLATRSDFQELNYPADDQLQIYSAFAAPGQEDSLTFVAAGDYVKNPRVQGKEVFFSTVQDGVWKSGLSRVSNSHGVAVNPLFEKQGDGSATVLFMLQHTYEQFDIYYNSDNKAYAAATNHENQTDYVDAMMNVPQYMGIAVVISFMVIAWPLLSYAYLFYFVIKRREDDLYDHAERHLLIAMALNFISEVWVFTNYGKLDNIKIYAPDWMHGSGGIALLLFLIGVLSYFFTKVFYSKFRYERHALPEFSYYFAINAWTVLLGFSYFMAT